MARLYSIDATEEANLGIAGCVSAAAGSPEVADIAKNPFRAEFALLANSPELVYLDSAATEQRPACVLDAQRRFYETMNANPLRGLYRLSIEATEAIARARAHVGRFIGAPEADEVVFVRNASEALNLAAKGLAGICDLKPGDEVAISIMEHHSNLIPWQQLCRTTGATLVYLRPEKGGDYAIPDEEIGAKIGPKTRIVSIGQVSNVLGVENPVRAIAKRAHEMGAYVVVDGAQAVPHMAVDVCDLGADMYAFSAHKIMGPMGIGVLWGKREILEAMPPMLLGGEMIDWVSETEAAWAPIPEKFEAGTQDAAGAYALDAALTYVESIGMDNLVAREHALMRYLVTRMEELPYIEFMGSHDPARHHGAFSFNVAGIHPHDVSSLLDGYNVAIRAGHHCAQPLLTWLGGMGSSCRASIGVYNDKNDIDRLVEGLEGVWGMFHGTN